MTQMIISQPYSSTYIDRLDRSISFIVVFQITALLIKNMFVTTLQFAANYNSYLNELMYVVMGAIYLRFLVCYGFRLKLMTVFVLLICLIFWLVSFVFNSSLLQYSYLRSALVTFLVYCVPLLIFIPLLHNPDTLMDILYKYSRFSAVMAILCWVLVMTGMPTVADYSMSYGKAAVVPCVVLFVRYLKDKRRTDLVLFMGCTVAIMTLGSRWPLLSIAAAISYGVIRYLAIGKKKVLIILLLLLLVIGYQYYSEHVILLIQRAIANMGINSRTINLLVSGEIAYSSGRTEIHDTLILKLNESPLIGFGAGGAYIALNDELAHSFILDASMNFGYPLAIAIVTGSAFLTMWYFWKNRFSSYGELIMVYTCLFWPAIAVGESFWSSDKFWMLISLFILGHYMKRNIEEKENTI